MSPLPSSSLHSPRPTFQLAAQLANYMRPPTFVEYRRDLEMAQKPYLPYLGLIFQQLILLQAGNSVFMETAEDATTPASRLDPSGPSSCENPSRLLFTDNVAAEPVASGGVSGGSCQPQREPIFTQPWRASIRIRSPEVGTSRPSTATSSGLAGSDQRLINVWRMWKHYLIISHFIGQPRGPPLRPSAASLGRLARLGSESGPLCRNGRMRRPPEGGSCNGELPGEIGESRVDVDHCCQTQADSSSKPQWCRGSTT